MYPMLIKIDSEPNYFYYEHLYFYQQMLPKFENKTFISLFSRVKTSAQYCLEKTVHEYMKTTVSEKSDVFDVVIGLNDQEIQAESRGVQDQGLPRMETVFEALNTKIQLEQKTNLRDKLSEKIDSYIKSQAQPKKKMDYEEESLHMQMEYQKLN